MSVAFPKGIITEWYPHPTQIGPAETEPTTLAPTIDRNASLSDSRVTWRDLMLVPAAQAGTKLAAQLPAGQAGHNYFAARETDSDYVQTGSGSGTNETEKFLFYRGAGSFGTPLHVLLDASNHFALGNTGFATLTHLLLLHVQDGYGAFTEMDTVPPCQTNGLPGWAAANNSWQRFPLAQFKEAIGAQMEAALVSEGLFDREARAMVNTWRESWFTEAGTRVLYILPRAWTDVTLPMTLNPQPNELVRVMVGRAEIITPETQTHLLESLTRAQQGDRDARDQAARTIRNLGRFAMPALALALGPDNTNTVAELGYQLWLRARLAKN